MARISAKRRDRIERREKIERRDEVRPHGGPVVAPAGWRNDALAVVIGVAAWFVFARVLHPWLIGVAVWPGQA